jgi:hypothetical protein
VDTRQECDALLERQKGDDRRRDLVYIPAATEALTNRLANGICETDVGLGSNSQSAAV